MLFDLLTCCSLVSLAQPQRNMTPEQVCRTSLSVSSSAWYLIENLPDLHAKMISKLMVEHSDATEMLTWFSHALLFWQLAERARQSVRLSYAAAPLRTCAIDCLGH
jgi:hypothetical protein